ncbi:MAG: nucleotidyltransferase family protein [Oscillospiraceae bacterium]
MKIAGIIAEYNPYHNGHAWLASWLREQGATHIVAVMSGHLVQRGEPALFSKWTRTEAALRCGVDLVLELPSLFAACSAEKFADAAVSLLEATGCTDWLGFGSECGRIAPLWEAARACLEEAADETIRRELKQGVPYAAARQKAVERLAGPEVAAVLAEPNNILGVEYLKALLQRNSAIQPLTIGRQGIAHDGKEPSGQFASASALRRMLTGLAPVQAESYLPAAAWELYQCELEAGGAPCRLEALERGILYRLRTMEAADFDRLPDVSEGLAERLVRAARSAATLEEFYTLAKTKRYAHARLRRIALYAALGVVQEDVKLQPAYLRILGMNQRGREVAARMKQTSSLPYGTSFAKLASYGGRIAEIECCAAELWALGTPKVLPYGRDYTQEAIFL